MASGQTSNYQLNQWAATDPVLRADFNADNQKIELAIMEKASIVIGTYTGTGLYGQTHPTTLDFADTLGKAPKLLIIARGSWNTDLMVLINGMQKQASIRHYSTSGGENTITWTQTGVSWYNISNAENQLNSDFVYYYCAIA